MADQPKSIVRRALQIRQNERHALFALALTADESLEIADVSKVSRDEMGHLIGYQRSEVRSHVNEIVEYLDGQDVLFPNSIIIALSSSARFRASRGPGNTDGVAVAGTLEIPSLNGKHRRPGWIVDGQQRMLALSKSIRHDLPVPVTAFIADDLEVQRDQFLRINNAKPLPRGLVTELLPEVSSNLPPRLAARRIPSELCDVLNQRDDSPFKGLIKRSSTDSADKRATVITDTSVITMLQESLSTPSGCLFPYRNLSTGETDFESILRTLIVYWSGVRETFPDAWGRRSRESRLTHGVGIRSMGRLMDRLMGHVDPFAEDAPEIVQRELALVAPICAWTDGRWDGLNLAWNDLQNVPKHVQRLSNLLIREYVQRKMAA